MFGSQVLETAIGLAVMFFILATAASAITESFSRVMKKRASDLETTLKEMLTAPGPAGHEGRKARKKRLGDADAFFDLFKETSVWQAAEAAAGRTLLLRRKVGNSYLSAKSFADAVEEVVTSEPAQEILDKVPSLKKRLTVLVEETTRGMVDVKAGLESWFDETMARAEGAYKRWASLILLLVGLFLAVVANASTTDVARDLWQDSATRSAVAEAASNVGDDPDDITDVGESIDALDASQLPVGWDVEQKDPELADNPWDFLNEFEWNAADLYTILGWLFTAILVMLGGPFWYDLLARLVSLRSGGKKPPTAADDATSASALATADATAEPPRDPGGRQESRRAAGDRPGFTRLRAALRSPGTGDEPSAADGA